MDPDATWQSLIQALIDDDRETASDLASSLLGWLEAGGFSPQVLPDLGQAASDPESPAYQLNRMVVGYVCARVRMVV
jgi:hypothetical protein